MQKLTLNAFFCFKKTNFILTKHFWQENSETHPTSEFYLDILIGAKNRK